MALEVGVGEDLFGGGVFLLDLGEAAAADKLHGHIVQIVLLPILVQHDAVGVRRLIATT